MKLRIIQPTHYKNDGALYKTRTRSLVGLTLPYLAALTPPGWEIELVDEQVQDLACDARADLVALSTWTINSLRAWDIAKHFRRRGIPVVVGGPHTFFHAEEAAEHCDAVCIGEAESVWPTMLTDAAAGRLKRFYRPKRAHDLVALPVPRYDLVDLRRYGRFRTYAVQSSRGCPFACEFCSERFYVGTAYRGRPVDDIVHEIETIGARNVFFADSMFAAQKPRTMQLMERLIPLRIRWSTLWTTYLCLDDEFMDLAKRSGLLHVNMGMESVDQATLRAMNKNFNKVHRYEEIIASLRKRGISYSFNFVFGFDGEDPAIFDQTLEFLRRHKVPVAYFYILAPHKGTAFYDRMKRDGRIIDEKLMRRTPGMVCYIRPKYCSPRQLERSVQRMYERFYTLPSMLRRLPPPITKAHIASWVLNFSQRRMRNRLRQNFDWA